MQQWQEALEKATNSVRCTARTRQGLTCKSPAMPNGKCRMHGGASTGAPCGKKHGRYKHGMYTKESIASCAYLNQLMQDAGTMIDEVKALV